MAKQDLNTIKNWFKSLLKPTQQQFWDTFDSFWHKDQVIPTASIQNLDGRFDEKADAQLLQIHMNDPHAHGIGVQADPIDIFGEQSYRLEWTPELIARYGKLGCPLMLVKPEGADLWSPQLDFTVSMDEDNTVIYYEWILDGYTSKLFIK